MSAPASPSVASAPSAASVPSGNAGAPPPPSPSPRRRQRGGQKRPSPPSSPAVAVGGADPSLAAAAAASDVSDLAAADAANKRARRGGNNGGGRGGGSTFSDKDILQSIDIMDNASVTKYFPLQNESLRRTVPINIRGFSRDYKLVFSKIREYRKLSVADTESKVKECQELPTKTKDKHRRMAKRAIADGRKAFGIVDPPRARPAAIAATAAAATPPAGAADTREGGDDTQDPAVPRISERRLVNHSVSRAASMTRNERDALAGVDLQGEADDDIHEGLCSSKATRDALVEYDESLATTSGSQKRPKGVRPRKVFQQSDSRAIGSKLDLFEQTALCSDTITVQDLEPHHLRNIVCTMSLNQVADTAAVGGKPPSRSRRDLIEFTVVVNSKQDLKKVQTAFADIFGNDEAKKKMYKPVFIMKEDGEDTLLPKALAHTNGIRESRGAPKKTALDLMGAQENMPEGSYESSDSIPSHRGAAAGTE